MLLQFCTLWEPETVKGFAQTLALGIAVSMFTALFVTRLLLNAFYAAGLKDEKFYGRTKEHKNIDFLGKKAIFFVLSGAVIIGGFVAMGIHSSKSGNALNYSLEFKGGTSTNVTFNEDMSIEELDEKVVPKIEEMSKDANVQTQKVQGTNQVIFKTVTMEVDQREELSSWLEEEFDVNPDTIMTETISSTVSSEMRTGAVVAVIVSSICMLIYVALRFKDVRFGASSVLALLHDVLVVPAFYAIARVSVGNTFIACMLTIVGYSINATIVIFDRVRENLKAGGSRAELKEVVNSSISQTLSRSIFTSLTTFVMVSSGLCAGSFQREGICAAADGRHRMRNIFFVCLGGRILVSAPHKDSEEREKGNKLMAKWFVAAKKAHFSRHRANISYQPGAGAHHTQPGYRRRRADRKISVRLDRPDV